MLNPEITKKIENLVYIKPRSVQEIAQHLDKNWRTADRYIDEIEKEFGTISTRVFREGTRGALKIVFWASIEKASSSVFQEILEQEIMKEKRNENFSAFDIYQHVSNKEKDVWMQEGESEIALGKLRGLKDMLLKAKKQILLFSGNLSVINYKNSESDTFKVLEELVKKGVSIKILTRVDLTGKENVEKMLSLNHKYGKELVEIRHREHPLRVTIVDDQFFNLKEIREPMQRERELSKRTFLFYTIYDKEWISWIKRIFWKMFSLSVDAKKRLEELSKLKKQPVKNNYF